MQVMEVGLKARRLRWMKSREGGELLDEKNL